MFQEESNESEVETITYGHKHKQKVALICSYTLKFQYFLISPRGQTVAIQILSKTLPMFRVGFH